MRWLLGYRHVPPYRPSPLEMSGNRPEEMHTGRERRRERCGVGEAETSHDRIDEHFLGYLDRPSGAPALNQHAHNPLNLTQTSDSALPIHTLR